MICRGNMIYVCSPFKGDDIEQNIERARRYCRKIAMTGRIPFAPHLYFPQFLDDAEPQERERGIDYALKSMWFCSEVWVFGDVISEGMRREIDHAKKTRKVVKYFGTEHDL